MVVREDKSGFIYSGLASGKIHRKVRDVVRLLPRSLAIQFQGLVYISVEGEGGRRLQPPSVMKILVSFGQFFQKVITGKATV